MDFVGCKTFYCSILPQVSKTSIEQTAKVVLKVGHGLRKLYDQDPKGGRIVQKQYF